MESTPDQWLSIKDKYDVKKPLGSGSFGEVMMAKCKKSG